jgi:phosphonopyruvate decarboxylase
MEQITDDLLKLMQRGSATFPQTDEQIEPQLTLAMRQMTNKGLPYALVMPKGSVKAYERQSRQPPVSLPKAAPDVGRSRIVGTQLSGEAVPSGRLGTSLSRTEAIRTILEQISHKTLLIATTGKTGRELFELSERPNHFYMVGSMGCASSLGLGRPTLTPAEIAARFRQSVLS